MLRLLLEELYFLLAALGVILRFLFDDGLDGLNLFFLLGDLFLLFLLSLLELFNFFLAFDATMLCLQLLAHSEGHRAE